MKTDLARFGDPTGLCVKGCWKAIPVVVALEVLPSNKYLKPERAAFLVEVMGLTSCMIRVRSLYSPVPTKFSVLSL